MSDFHLETDRLIILNWQETDCDLFHLINSDEKVMEFFPFRRNRKQSDKMMDDLKAGIDKKGYGFTALALKNTNEAIGFCGLAEAGEVTENFRNSIEIGWRLAPKYWRMGYVTEAAIRLIRFGFEELNLPEIVSFAVPANTRSTAVMERIGMIRDAARDFDHPRVPDTHPDFVRHVVYSLKNPIKKGLNEPL